MYTVFTFHNVSINTVYKVSEVLRYPDDLHSTMFLLILLQVRLYRCSSIFTFHNVSINTEPQQSRSGETETEFTFHNVSINTQLSIQ